MRISHHLKTESKDIHFRLEKEVERHQIKFNRDSTFVNADGGSPSKSASVAMGNRKAVSSYASAAKRGGKSDAAPSSSSAAVTRKPASFSEGADEAATTVAPSSSRGAWDDGHDATGEGEKNVECLERRISGLLDENEALQKTLEATLAAKKQDLALLQEMMTQTKSIFIKAMKELKGN